VAGAEGEEEKKEEAEGAEKTSVNLARHLTPVIAGLDPAIHEAAQQQKP
jgi:hypothetical protein